MARKRKVWNCREMRRFQLLTAASQVCPYLPYEGVVGQVQVLPDVGDVASQREDEDGDDALERIIHRVRLVAVRLEHHVVRCGDME